MGISLSMENEHLLVLGLDKGLGKYNRSEKKLGLKVELCTVCISPVVLNIFDKNNIKDISYSKCFPFNLLSK